MNERMAKIPVSELALINATPISFRESKGDEAARQQNYI
jgi:hypothetical protein